MSDRAFAIVVFGASGFTGQFVAREVAKNCKRKFKWAVAGRSKDKLEKVLQETSSELGKILASLNCKVSGVFWDFSIDLVTVLVSNYLKTYIKLKTDGQGETNIAIFKRFILHNNIRILAREKLTLLGTTFVRVCLLLGKLWTHMCV